MLWAVEQWYGLCRTVVCSQCPHLGSLTPARQPDPSPAPAGQARGPSRPGGQGAQQARGPGGQGAQQARPGGPAGQGARRPSCMSGTEGLAGLN